MDVKSWHGENGRTKVHAGLSKYYVADFLRVCFVVWRISLRGGEISSEISQRMLAQVVVFKDFSQLVGFSG